MGALRVKRKRKILFITGSRGEYGYIRPIIKLINKTSDLEYVVVATNMHLLPEFGLSICEFERDGIEVKYRPYMAFGGYTGISMVKSMGAFLMSLSDIVTYENIDMILLAGDRGEQLIGAMVGSHLQIPVAHIQAGEVSGNIDGMTRHAITKYAHLHFAANEDASNRLIRMGEEPFRIKLVGAPQLDELLSLKLLEKQELFSRYNLDPYKPLILLVQHSVTEQVTEAREQMKITMKAVGDLKNQVVIIYPNNDAGSTVIQNVIEETRSSFIRVERNIPRIIYASLLKHSTVIVGNSSSGIIEAPSFGLPAVNIGRRQNGRIQGENVINVDHNVEEIKEGIKKSMAPHFRSKLKETIKNPYGDGKSSERIVEILRMLEIDSTLLTKHITY